MQREQRQRKLMPLHPVCIVCQGETNPERDIAQTGMTIDAETNNMNTAVVHNYHYECYHIQGVLELAAVALELREQEQQRIQDWELHRWPTQVWEMVLPELLDKKPREWNEEDMANIREIFRRIPEILLAMDDEETALAKMKKRFTEHPGI